MSIFIAIVGLAFLILIHEAGHFFVALAVGMRPRKFYVGFPPALVKTTTNGIEYGIGAIPLGGYVKIPGMHRPAAWTSTCTSGRRARGAPRLRRPARAPEARARPRTTSTARRAALARARRALGGLTLRRRAALLDAAWRSWTTHSPPDAYWRAATWKRIAAIWPARARTSSSPSFCFAVLFMRRRRQGDDAPSRRSGGHAGRRPPGCGPATRSSRSTAPGHPDDDRRRDQRARRARPLTVTVERDGEAVDARPGARRGSSEGRYRLGFVLARRGPAASAPRPGSRVKLTGIVTKEIGESLGRLVTARAQGHLEPGRDHAAARSEAVEQGYGTTSGCSG